jgi:hypothetical protein
VSGRQGEDYGKLALRPDGHIADTERLAEIAREMNVGWPPLTQEQRDKLALILHPGRGHDGTP